MRKGEMEEEGKTDERQEVETFMESSVKDEDT